MAKTQKSIEAGSATKRQTIFHTLLGLDPSLYDTAPLAYCTGEAFAFLTAASDTTGNAMGMACYHIVTHPDIYSKLRAELVERFPDPEQPMPVIELEKLPYLTAVVKEGLR